MSLPPGFIDELRGRLSLGQVVGRKVMWDNRKSNPGKGDLWAPCPFHQEKSASFHVDDRKGFYYCFGCHAKGDAFSFVRETENVGFMEAVAILAAEAGMPMPERDPRAQEKADRRDELAQVMEQAVQHYRLQLRTGAAAAARDYLARRGLSDEAQARWEIGFAPDARTGLLQALTGRGVAAELTVEAGLCARPEGGGQPYDRFRGRIIFPIRDARGRAIALGGRAMDPNARAKYLNSPETALFDKGRSLFNIARAREAAGKGQPLIVAEGYMDVIALSEAGFGAAVAPLGTAVTEDQLRMMWRIAPEPVIALDGDTAGLRAAMRVIDIALPLLEAGQSLRFALMPDKMDPDDVLRAQGPAAMTALVEGAIPMVQLLWRRETEGRDFDSPERRAALDKALRARIATIRDPSIRTHYGEAIKELRWDLFGARRRGAGTAAGRAGQPGAAGRAGPGAGSGAARGARGFGATGRRGWDPPPVPMPATLASALALGSAVPDHLREAVILATLIATPAALPAFEGELERMQCADPDHEALRVSILRHGSAPGGAPGSAPGSASGSAPGGAPEVGPDTLPGTAPDGGPGGAAQRGLRDAIAAELGLQPLEKLFAHSHVAIAPAVRRPGDLEMARMCLAEELAKLNARRGHAREIEEAVEDLNGVADEGVTWRLSQAAQAINRAGSGDAEDRTEYEKGANGALMNKDERSAFDLLLGKIDFAKGGRGPGPEG